MRFIALLFVNISFVSFVFGQPGWNWPENKSSAEEKNVLYADYLKEGNCEAALELIVG